MSDILFSSDNQPFTVRLSREAMDGILNLCRESNTKETGGILIGHYDSSHSQALISFASEPGFGSKHENSKFFRAVGQLQSLLNKLWKTKKGYYLGEWHFHPFSSPEPSSIDCNQMFEIAKNRKASCPEAILIIIGGDPSNNWSVSINIFIKSGQRITLKQSSS